jgi:hypothetical protein
VLAVSVFASIGLGDCSEAYGIEQKLLGQWTIKENGTENPRDFPRAGSPSGPLHRIKAAALLYLYRFNFDARFSNASDGWIKVAACSINLAAPPSSVASRRICSEVGL